ncbi:MAG TPA: histidine kinase [Flavobacteriaceae bacterium]|nr:histidine kinase [Flavobacteriaceae bacterium]MCB9213450.1 histidine kinase [Alteromonas sp.]HPF12247.1 histidine kinase [Flavobacteriaceae bacterium]HQU22468.1 histidine kinase [Flavobacteriaceae bacterium]HQU66507.1 histidine kinase [Flavobacteriaceae bacterium]
MRIKLNLKSISLGIAHTAFWLIGFYLITRLFGVKNVEVYSNVVSTGDTSEKVLVTYDEDFRWAATLTLGFSALIFYLNVFYLLRAYFKNKNLFIYLSRLIGIVMACVLLDFVLNTVLVYKLPLSDNWFDFPFAGLHLGLVVFYLVISFTYAFIFEWYRNEKLRNIIKQEKLSTELNFLKSQVNPHFLFNTLNNLFSIAQKHHINELTTGIGQLSNLMRYMLYESNSNFVSLKKEIEHIESYIEIQKLRYDETDEVLINFEKRGDWQSKQIAPMLLLPFVENAFKHGVSIHGSSVIAIFLETTAASLLFKVRNKIRNEKKSIHDVSGIGLENVKRRLDLIYPNQYDLAIRTEKDHYEVALIISS